jgi:hypothetical protein
MSGTQHTEMVVLTVATIHLGEGKMQILMSFALLLVCGAAGSARAQDSVQVVRWDYSASEIAEKVTSIYGYPAQIEGQTYYSWSSQQTLDYIPPGAAGYFEDYHSIPAGVDTSKTDIKVTWSWAENAVIATELEIVEGTLTIRAENTSYSTETIVSGELKNTTDATIKSASIYFILLGEGGQVWEIASSSTVDEFIAPGGTSSFSVPDFIGSITDDRVCSFGYVTSDGD